MQPHPFAKFTAILEPTLPFTAEDGQARLRIRLDCGGFFTLPIRSQAFHDWYFAEFYGNYEYQPTPREFRAVVDHLQARAHHRDERNTQLPVFRRVGRLGRSRILLDLATTGRDVVEISAGAWKIISSPDILFQTSRSTHPLPNPVPAPQPPAPNPLDTLRSCLNLPSRPSWLRCLAWLLAALCPNGPYPFLIFQGPPGSGKSFTARVLRSLIDPSSAPLTPNPSSTRDLITVARLNWILAFDHISALSPLLADTLCRLSSGLGATFREAAGPAHEPLQQSFRRPILLTVTGRFVCPEDIAKRALVVTLPPFRSATRTEESLVSTLTPAWPAVLGALCTAVSTALSRTPTTYQPTGPCADALAWAVAASPALGCTEEEMQRAFDPPPLPHPIVLAVRNLLEQRKSWTGSATELRDLLEPFGICTTPRGVSQHLNNSMLTLADHGIELKFRRLHGGDRVIDLREDPGDANSENDPEFASPNSDQSQQPKETEEVKAS